MRVPGGETERERKRKREGRTECRPNSSAVTRFYDTDIKFGFQRETRAGLAEDDRLSLIISAVPSLDIARNSANIVQRIYGDLLLNDLSFLLSFLSGSLLFRKNSVDLVIRKTPSPLMITINQSIFLRDGDARKSFRSYLIRDYFCECKLEEKVGTCEREREQEYQRVFYFKLSDASTLAIKLH